ncbi:MAG TPA: thiamine-phosphate kinase [Gemmatimonadaceae bacterium]|jgi:thiamine-monophosphate kinase|nr:thiamine-phosphate kinase [Gemmatimonadaceae bacterium]
MSQPPYGSIPLGDGAEFDAIRAMLKVWGPELAGGIGDDAALIPFAPHDGWLVASTDASVESVHFRREWLSSREIGGRATAAALSDLAAMAAEPLGLLLALGVPDDWRSELDEIACGVGDLARSMACPIVGGNITRASELSLTITVLGSTPRPTARDRVRAGDTLYVTGRLGGPGAALEALLRGETPDPAHRARFASPVPRIAEARWLADHGALAAIDISDGLVADAGHLASASRVAIELDLHTIPCVDGVAPEAALRSGEEYELVVAFSEDSLPDVAAFEAELGLPLTRVGRAVAGAGVTLLGPHGRVDPPRGHDHLT